MQQKLLHQGRLANTGIARDKGELRPPVLGVMQGLLELAQLGLTADKGRHLAHGYLLKLWLDAKAIALPAYRLNKAGCTPLLAQRLAQLPDADSQDTLAHMGIRPDMLRELLARDNPARVLEQVT
jgi:hypothetical protein